MAPDNRAAAEQLGDVVGVRSVRRALKVVSLLRRDHPVVTLREVLESTELPRTTAIRLISTLEDCGLLWLVDTNSYIIGPALLRWNGLAAEAWHLPLGVQRAMEVSAKRSRETVTLFVREGVQRICIGQVEGDRALRMVTRVGSEHPLWAGAPAKVLLDGLDDDGLRQLAAVSPRGRSDVERLRLWRDEATSAGYAVSHNEREDGLSAVAVPVRSTSGSTLAALSVSGPKERFGEKAIEQYRVALQQAATEMHGKQLYAFAWQEFNGRSTSEVGPTLREDGAAAAARN